ncbi:MAG: DUF2497 domain-containing protein [Alphaproteobacteria bacterium]
MTEANSQDPSMEDILSSIRRILSEDEEAGGEEASAAPEEVFAEEIQQEVAFEEPVEEFAPIEEEVVDEQFGQDGIDQMFDEPVFEEPIPEEPIFEEPVFEEPEEVLELTDSMAYNESYDEDSIISKPAATATACSLAELAKAVASDRNLGLGGQGVTLEELVKQMLKPFLKEWLDANLPYVVERIVKKEIARVIDKASL